jgi:hypothetical protein
MNKKLEENFKDAYNAFLPIIKSTEPYWISRIGGSDRVSI